VEQGGNQRDGSRPRSSYHVASSPGVDGASRQRHER